MPISSHDLYVPPKLWIFATPADWDFVFDLTSFTTCCLRKNINFFKKCHFSQGNNKQEFNKGREGYPKNVYRERNG